MPQHVFTLVAQGHSVDAQTNNLTVFSIVEQVNAPALPFGVFEFHVMTLWKAEEQDKGLTFVQRTVFRAPSGKQIFDNEASFSMEKPRHRTLLVVGQLPFEETGTYALEVYIRRHDSQDWGKPVAVYPLEVTFRSAPTQPQAVR